MAQYKLTTNKAEDFEQLARIAFNLRHFTKVWDEHYGSTNRNAKVLWQSRMDEFLAKNVEIIAGEEGAPEVAEKWSYQYLLKTDENIVGKVNGLPDTKSAKI